MKFLLTFSLFLFFTGTLASQTDSIKKQKIDSLRLKFKADSARIYRFNKYRPYANIDNRNSFIRNKPVNLQGVQIGFILKEYHVFGIGYYTMTQQSQKPVKTNEDTRTLNRSLNLNYYTLFYQYVLLDKRFLEIDLPFEIGYGTYTLKFEDALTKDIVRNTSAPIVPMGAGVQIVLKPFRWIGFCTMSGYRYVADQNVNVNFNGFYYSFGLWLDVRQAYRDIKFYGSVKKKYKRAVNEILKN
jgi:hypothetical protein